MIELMANEAEIIENMKKFEGIQLHPVSIGYTTPKTGYIIKRLVDMGIILRSGRRMHYKYQIPDFTYVIIERRLSNGQPLRGANEPLPQSIVEPFLTADQRFYLAHHFDKLPRNILMQRLGISKLQLNFYIDKNKSMLKGERSGEKAE